MLTTRFFAIAVPIAVVASLASDGHSGSPRTAAEDARARCANRLALSLMGGAASSTLRAAPDPQQRVDELLASPQFVETFSRFINSKLNDEPGAMPSEDAAYWLARYVLEQDRPWHELFDGHYRVEPVPDMPTIARVVADPAGLGYFRSPSWVTRYGGNEEQGYRLTTAFRIQQNIVGLDVTAVTTLPGADTSATGRMSPACRGCHYDSYFALDKVAKILSRKNGAAPNEGPQQVLGTTIANDEQLVTTLVRSTDHAFRTCRLAFEYLYGRPEATCEAALFDACIDAYTSGGDVRAALRTIARDPGFCQ